MNTTLLLHLIRKDFSAFRGPLILLWLSVAAVVVTPLSADKGTATLVFGMMVAAYVLLALIQALLIQLDPARGVDHFLATRPVAKSTLLGSKLILFLGAGIAPILLGGLILLARANIDAPAAAYAWSAIKGIMLLIGAAGIFALVAAYTTTIPMFIFCTMGTAFLLWLPLASHIYFVNLIPVTVPKDPCLFLTRSFLFLLCCGVTAYVLVAARYIRSGWMKHGLILCGGYALAVITYQYWPINFVPAQKPPVVPSSDVAEVIKQVKIQVQPERIIENYNTYKGTQYPGLLVAETIENVPNQYFVTRRSSRSVGHLPNGEVVPSEYFLPGNAITPQASIGSIAASLNVSTEGVSLYAKSSYGVFNYKPSKTLPNLEGVKIHIQNEYDVFEPVVVAELPLKVGSAFARDGVRLEVAGVDKTSGTATLKTLATNYTPLAITDRTVCANDYLFLVEIPEIKSLISPTLQAISRRGSNNILENISIENYRVSFENYEVLRMQTPIPPEWIQDTKVYVIHCKRVGTFSRSFEIAAETEKSAQ